MSAFSILAAQLDSPAGSLCGYMLDEAAGATQFANLGSANLPLTTINGAVSLGYTPGLIAGHASARQLKDTHLAHRADNILLDRPAGPAGNPDKYTLFSFIETAKIKGKSGAGSGGYAIVQKGGICQMIQRGTGIQATTTGQGTSLSTPAETIAGGGVYWIVVSFDRNVAWTIHINGIEVARRTFGTPATAPNWVAGGNLDVGGSSGFESGTWGRLGFTGILYNNSLGTDSGGLAKIRNLYTAAIDPATGGAANVTAWSQQILPANASRERLWLGNDSDATIYLALGNGPAFPNSGRKLAPFIGEWESDVYKGAVHAIIAEPIGTKRLLFEET